MIGGLLGGPSPLEPTAPTRHPLPATAVVATGTPSGPRDFRNPQLIHKHGQRCRPRSSWPRLRSSARAGKAPSTTLVCATAAGPGPSLSPRSTGNPYQTRCQSRSRCRSHPRLRQPGPRGVKGVGSRPRPTRKAPRPSRRAGVRPPHVPQSPQRRNGLDPPGCPITPGGSIRRGIIIKRRIRIRRRIFRARRLLPRRPPPPLPRS